MNRSFQFATAAAVALGVGTVCMAGDDITPLKIGQPAPPIEVTHWLKGQPVTKFEPGKVYVLEFWATWCGPCRGSMPHMSEMQAELKDYGVTFVGVSDEELQTVVKFLCSPDKNDESKLWNEKISYTLATDPDRSVYETYMYGVGAMGIPTAFIIGKQGEVEWVGNPHPESDDNIDKVLDAVVKDQWNRAEFAQAFEPQAEKDRAELAKMLAEQAKTKPYRNALKQARADKDWPAAIKAIDGLIASDENAFQYKMQKFTLLLIDMNEPANAYAYGEELTQGMWDQAQPLNAIAWEVVDNPKVQTRNLDFALKTAQRASELTENKEGAILDTLARVYFEKGDLKQAVKWQKIAVENAPEPMAAELKAALEKYENELAKQGG